ncbi:MAG: hypothetical protein GW761_11625 [Leptospira sp.]|nr:hypothetical protein [Leptospira sp.]
MSSLLIFIFAVACIFFIAILINKIRGIKASYIDSLELSEDEPIIWQDVLADFHIVTKMGQAMFMSFSRMRRAKIIITDQRIIVGQKVFLGKKYLITHMLYFSADPKMKKDLDSRTEEALDSITAGQYSLGYLVYLVDKNQFSAEMDGKKCYLKIIPVSTKSSTNLEHCRLYSDLEFSFLN